MRPTDVGDPNYYHRVVDCQWACPAHTNVPEYIRLIAQGQFTEAYLLNRESNVFPGILGRTCDRPCEPACRRTRVDGKPVAICRLKRVAADNKGDIAERLPKAPAQKNGKRIALIGAGPASLTVANDLAPLGYECTIFEAGPRPGGLMRINIPAFRLPEHVLDEEIGYVLDMGVDLRTNTPVTSLKALLDEGGYDAVFVGSGAPKGKELELPGRHDTDQIFIGIEWLASIHFGHIETVGERVLIIGVGNTAMDCCRSSRRLGGEDVKVIVRSGFDEMKASQWEKEDAIHEGIPIINFHVPKSFVHEQGRLTGMTFEIVRAEYDGRGRRSLVPTGQPDVFFPCDDVLIAVGQENAFPWIERDAGVEFDDWGLPRLGQKTFQSSHPKVFFGGDAAFGPKNIITAVAQGHEAAVSIDRFLQGEDVSVRPPPMTSLLSQKMGIHEWSYDNDTSNDARFKVPWARAEAALASISVEVELGFDAATAVREAGRCLNCDVQTVFTAALCIECDGCVDICPTDCITFTAPGEEADLRTRLRAPATNLELPLLVSGELKTGNVMVKDEDVCLHCGLCAERCPTGAWDMQKFLFAMTHAGAGCRTASAPHSQPAAA